MQAKHLKVGKFRPFTPCRRAGLVNQGAELRGIGAEVVPQARPALGGTTSPVTTWHEIRLCDSRGSTPQSLSINSATVYPPDRFRSLEGIHRFAFCRRGCAVTVGRNVCVTTFCVVGSNPARSPPRRAVAQLGRARNRAARPCRKAPYEKRIFSPRKLNLQALN